MVLSIKGHKRMDSKTQISVTAVGNISDMYNSAIQYEPKFMKRTFERGLLNLLEVERKLACYIRKGIIGKALKTVIGDYKVDLNYSGKKFDNSDTAWFKKIFWNNREN